MQLNKKMGLTYVSPIFKEDLKVPRLKESPKSIFITCEVRCL